MDRREFLQTGSAGIAGAGLASATAVNAAAAEAASASAAPALVRARRELVLALPVALDTMVIGGQAFALARQIEAASGGGYRVSVARTGGTGFEAVTTGEADLYFAPEHQHVSWHPALVAYSALPGAEHLNAHEHDAWMRVGGGADLAAVITEETGVKFLLAGHTGPGCGLLSETVIEDTFDLRGRSVATRGLGCQVARRIGATPVVLDDDEIADALKAGTVTAAEPFLGEMLPIAHWQTAPAFHPGGFALSLGMRASLWAQLGPSERALFEGVAAGAMAQSAAEAVARQAMAGIAARDRRWPVSMTTSASLTAAIAAAASEAVSELAEKNASARRVVDSIRAFRVLIQGTSRRLIA